MEVFVGKNVTVKGTLKKGVVSAISNRRVKTASTITFVTVRFPDNSVMEYEVNELRSA